jgi:hypothetical protein
MFPWLLAPGGNCWKQRRVRGRVAYGKPADNHGCPSQKSDKEKQSMRVKIVSVLACAVLIVAIALPVVTSAAPPNGKANTAAGQARKGSREAHPHIRAAIRELQEAKRELQTAAHDFGGHRKEAIEAVDTAIKQLREALEYDKK